MIELSDIWSEKLLSQAETGMGYQIVSVILKNGKRYDRVIVNSGYITRIKGLNNIPFSEDEIAEIEVTHDKWDFDKE